MDGGGGDKAKQDDWLKAALNVPAARFRTPAVTATPDDDDDPDWSDTKVIESKNTVRTQDEEKAGFNTPFGEVTFPKSRERNVGKIWADLSDMLQQGKTWSETYAKQLSLLELPVRPIAAYIDAPEKAEEEITKAAPEKAVDKAETAENARDTLDLIEPVRVTIETLLQTALSEMKQANLEWDAEKKERKAIELRKEGEKLEQELDLAAEGFKAVVETAVEGPEGAIKGGAGLAAGLYKAFHENQLMERAEKLEKGAIDLHELAVGEAFYNAGAALKQIEPQIKKLDSMSGRSQRAALRQARRATKAFDECKCNFKFSKVVEATEAVRSTYEAALNEAKSWNSANHYITEYIFNPKFDVDLKSNGAVLAKMHFELQNHPKESKQHVADMHALLDKLNALYDRALEALANAPGVKSPGG